MTRGTLGVGVRRRRAGGGVGTLRAAWTRRSEMPGTEPTTPRSEVATESAPTAHPTTGQMNTSPDSTLRQNVTDYNKFDIDP